MTALYIAAAAVAVVALANGATALVEAWRDALIPPYPRLSETEIRVLVAAGSLRRAP